MKATTALLVVDVQNDFCPGGALAVPEGNRVVQPLNRALAAFAATGQPIIATRDWHPPHTGHFQPFGGLWPIHCVQGSTGAAYHSDLHLPADTIHLCKGIDAQLDGYSAFDGVDAAGTPLAALLATRGVTHLCIGGLATDYCIRASALDARNRGLAVTVLIDAIAGVDLQPGDSERALDEIHQAGAKLCKVDQAIAELGHQG